MLKYLLLLSVAVVQVNTAVLFWHSALKSTNSIGSDFQIFPNPTNKTLNVNIQNLSPDAHLYITNYLGEIIFEQALQNMLNTIDVADFSDGIYFIKIIGVDGVFTKKFIKN